MKTINQAKYEDNTLRNKNVMTNVKSVRTAKGAGTNDELSMSITRLFLKKSRAENSKITKYTNSYTYRGNFSVLSEK